MEEKNLEELDNTLLQPVEDVENLDNGQSKSISCSNLGKFKDVDALLTAYNNLQSDYTKKCQLLAKYTKEDKKEENKEEIDNSKLKEIVEECILSNDDLKSKVLKKCFEEAQSASAPKLIGSDSGSSVIISPQSKPKTLRDAERIVREMLNAK